ncbi:hypothetical protein SAMN05216378_3109 [Paenibacillus catalpae]|uniref:Uncharacterized protein n=1 Tax=Paenibacillus catalpae TaxID=1045775 RepID=A0A1I2AL60_9BACL|nr:hypothetical protein [Paenibacillus catalpae]SFE43683.1 hypothetical protein SAMN05216378_3109 [Paenibacillus catalpae]
MSQQTRIPHGDEKVTVELTVKELMALSGIRFHNNHHIEVSARKKLNEVIENTYRDVQAEGPIDYQLLV